MKAERDSGGWLGNLIGIMMGLLVLALGFVLVVIPYIEEKDLNNFCQDNGYNKGEYGMFTFQNSYCIKTEGNKLIKIEVQSCNERGMTLHDFCFVKNK